MMRRAWVYLFGPGDFGGAFLWTLAVLAALGELVALALWALL